MRIDTLVALLVGLAMQLAVGVAIADEAASKLPSYQIHRAGTPITVDGKLDEPAWVAAPDVGPFTFTWYKQGEQEQTIAKMLWDDEYLYVACICQDAHITARSTEHDQSVSADDCYEVIFAPDPNRPTRYFNIEWNVVGGYVDGFRPNAKLEPRQGDWTAKGLKLAGSFVGTLNDDSDTDSYWLVEAAIPLANFKEHVASIPPQPGTHWNLNFNRHGGATNEQYSQWSPASTPQPDFHTPLTWGRAIFSDRSSPFDRATK